jgi:hypothetical protein
VKFFSAYYNDICVGSIACRLEKKDGGSVRLYIMTLGVLAPYRRLGIGEFVSRLVYLMHFSNTRLRNQCKYSSLLLWMIHSLLGGSAR